MAQSQLQPKMSIPEFYDGKSVFITGGMGFVGKVLVEKILRSCPGVENIYLLCRSKKGKNINERLEEITSSPAFDLLRDQNPQALNKIILIEGDVSMLELGISKTDQEILKDKVSIVINTAATIDFNEPLTVAVNTNLRSIREMLSLIRQMKDLKSFVHVSTAYTNWFLRDVKEEIYPTEHDPHDIIGLCERLPDKTIDKFTPILLGKHVNTYTFTKSLTEKLLKNEAKNLPVSIVRPSMIGASMAEPKVGWTDSWGATTLFMYYIAKGIFRTVQHAKGNPLDIIPVDTVINMTIAASWKVAVDKELNPNATFPQIFHSTTGTDNPITLKEAFVTTQNLARIDPLNDVVWYPKIRTRDTKLGLDIDIYIMQYIPARVLDVVAKLFGQKPRALKVQQKVASHYRPARFGAAADCVFRSSNYCEILKIMNSNDKKVFNFDPKSINWKTYMKDYYFGIKKFLMKEQQVDPAVAKAKITRLKRLNYLTTASFAAIPLLTVGTIGKCYSDWKRQKTVN